MSHKIRILETIRQGKIGGGETHVLDLVQALDRDAFEPVVLSFTPGPMVDRLRELGVSTHVIRTERPFDLRCWPRVQQLLRAERIDLVHAHGTRAMSNTCWAARQLGLPVAYTVHGWSFHPNQHPVVRRYRQLSEKLLMAQATATICVSESNFQDGLEFSDMARATVIRNGINLGRFNPAVRPVRNVRAELGIGPATLLVGYLARITAQKDPLTLLRAVAMLPPDLDVKVLLVGEGDLKPEARRLARELRIEHRVVFEGFRQDVPELLEALDVYCLPSLWEGLPLGVLEAMAMGRPVVASGIDGTREIIDSGRNGLLVPPADPVKLAVALLQLLTNHPLRAEMGRQARQTVLAEFGAEAMVRLVEQLYRQLRPAPAARPQLAVA